MAGDPPTCGHACPTRWHMVVVVGERTNVCKHMDCLLESGIYPEVVQGKAHLMVGSPVGVEVVTKKARRKIFQQRQGVLTAVEDFYDEGGIAKKGLRH